MANYSSGFSNSGHRRAGRVELYSTTDSAETGWVLSKLLCCSSVVQSCLTVCNPMNCSMPGFSVLHLLLPWVCSNSCPLSQLCHPTISSSVIPFSSSPQFFPASGGQRIGASASASVLPMNIQGWFPLGVTGLSSLQSKGLSRVFNSTVQKHQFFDTQPSLWSNCHIHTWLLEKP